MKIRELLMCAIDQTNPMGDTAPAPAPTDQQMAASQAPAQMMPRVGLTTPRLDSLRDENESPVAPASGTFFARTVGRPPIPLK
jgi:hypothetical protein